MMESTETVSNDVTSQHIIRVREPKRIIHCSDGVIEEFSDDESDEESTKETVDPKTLTWMPWIVHQVVASGNKALEYCDYVGEGIADILGITTPKYQLELSEYERMEAAKKKLEVESAGWTTPDSGNGLSLVTLQPTSVASDIEKPTII